MRGRPPKPSAIRKLEGNPGHRSLNANEPKPENNAPSCPKHLSGEAKKEWKRIVPELEALGVLTRIDRGALAGYCSAWATYVEADQKIKTLASGETLTKASGEEVQDVGSLVITTTHGNLVPNPYLGIRNTALKLMHKFLVEFGLTPAARTRVHVSLPEDEGSLEAFIGTQ